MPLVSVTNTHDCNEAQIRSSAQVRRSEMRLKELVVLSHAWWPFFKPPSLPPLLVILLVMTYSQYDHHEIPGMYFACGLKQQNEHAFATVRECMLILLPRITPTHRHISHDFRDDYRLKMTRPSDWRRVGCTRCHQAYDGRINCLSLTLELVTLTWFCFSRNLS